MSYEDKLGMFFLICFILIGLFLISIPIILLTVIVICIRDKRRQYKINSIDNNKIPDSFKEKISNLNIMCNEKLNKLRSKISVFSILEILLGVCVVVGLIINIISSIHFIKVCSSIVVVIILLLFIIVKVIDNKYNEKYRQVYFEQIIPNILTLIDHNLTYDKSYIESDNSVSDYMNSTSFAMPGSYRSNKQKEIYDEYARAKFDSQHYNKIIGSDFINIKFAENYIKIKTILVKQSYGSSTYRHSSTNFHGLFAIVTCKSISKQYNKISTSNLIDNNEINSLVLQFHKEIGINCEIVVNQDKIYFRFFTGYKLNVNSFDKNINMSLLYTYFIIIKFIVDFTKKMNENI